MSIYATTPRRSRRTNPPFNPDRRLRADFDATACPIIARHWFGVEPLRPIGEIAAGIAADLKRQRQVARLHSLGPRPILEALIEVAASAELDTVLADYARLDIEVVIALGGDHFPTVPIHVVRP